MPVLKDVRAEPRSDVNERGRSNRRERTTDTFKHGQPCRVVREPDRIARQAGILPSVINRHIPQLQHLHLLVRGVKAGVLEDNRDPEERPEGGG